MNRRNFNQTLAALSVLPVLPVIANTPTPVYEHNLRLWFKLQDKSSLQYLEKHFNIPMDILDCIKISNGKVGDKFQFQIIVGDKFQFQTISETNLYFVLQNKNEIDYLELNSLIREYKTKNSIHPMYSSVRMYNVCDHYAKSVLIDNSRCIVKNLKINVKFYDFSFDGCESPLVNLYFIWNAEIIGDIQ